MEKCIITISREFGSGGRTIGKLLAKQLGYDYFDKEIIEQVAERTGYSPELLEEQGEYAPSKNNFAYSFLGRDKNGLSVNDYIWAQQRTLILEYAKKGKCVIVGRCADYILKNREDVLNVFIHADKNKRADRIVEVYGETDINPVKRVEEKDKKRAVNYGYYTEQKWGQAKNYHISLDSGEFGIDKCVSILAETFMKKIKNF